MGWFSSSLRKRDLRMRLVLALVVLSTMFARVDLRGAECRAFSGSGPRMSVVQVADRGALRTGTADSYRCKGGSARTGGFGDGAALNVNAGL